MVEWMEDIILTSIVRKLHRIENTLSMTQD